MPEDTRIVTVPAHAAGEPGRLPGHCARHGRPAVRRVDFALQSKVRIEGNRALSGNVLSLGDRLGQHAKKVRVVHVKGWPLCDRCHRARVFWLGAASVMFFGGLVAFAGSLLAGIVADTPPALAAVAAVGFVVMILAAFPFALGSLGRLTGARASSDGTAVEITGPSPAFTAGLPPGTG